MNDAVIKTKFIENCDCCGSRPHVVVCPTCQLRLCRVDRECPECEKLPCDSPGYDDIVDTQLRFFSERVFGRWVNGVVQRVRKVRGKKPMLEIAATFGFNSWTELVPADRDFYYPSGHPRAGEEFHFEEFL